MKNKEDFLSMISNNAIFLDYFNRLKLIAISIAKWNGLPETCDPRFLELSLFDFGKAIFVKDERLGYLNLNVTWGSELNVYNLPNKYLAFSVNYSKMYDADNSVLIMNNLLMRPTADTITLYAKRLYDIQTAQDINVVAQKTPVLLQCNNKQRVTLENLYKKYDGNMPFIFGDKSYNLQEMISSIKTDAPFIADKLQTLKLDVINEVLTFLGIDNANTSKKERLITDEANANNELINMYMDTFITPRKMACEKINKLYPDLNVSVEVNENMLNTLLSMLDDIPLKFSNGGDNNGNIYNPS